MEQTVTEARPDVVILMTDQERAAPPYETDELAAWRAEALPGRRWFEEHGVSFARHYTGSLACVPSRPTIFTGHYPDTHGVTQTDGGGKTVDDARMRWLRADEVPTLGHWFRAAGYDTHYDGKWHISHAELHGPDGNPLATNDAEGRVDPAAVQAYLDADPLDPYGFSGWVGPEPHGAKASDSGLVRDPLIADRVVAWLEDRYARRRSGDVHAQRPFLLVASFVNPHDICLVAGWAALGWPLEPSPLDPPPMPPAPTAHEDLSTKPRAQAAYRESFWSCFAPATVTRTLYQRNAQRERDLYLRLHAEVDAPLDRVRRTVAEGSRAAVLVRTSDHGELLGAHGGLRQKWFTLYDEATRVPFVIARTGSRPTEPRIVEAPTSHVDVVPTLLAAAGVDTDAVAAQLAETFTEVHPLPGRSLLPVVDGEAPDEDRAVYLQTKDNVMEGDSGVPVVGRVLGIGWVPPPLRIQVPAGVGSSFEGIVARVDAAGLGHRWKLVRVFDDPATWTDPGRRHLHAVGPLGETTRSSPVPDEWELDDLDADGAEADNWWGDPTLADVQAELVARLDEERSRSLPGRNRPWPVAARRASRFGLGTLPRPSRIVDVLRNGITG
jgi:arylsulfatase A-like enzyme